MKKLVLLLSISVGIFLTGCEDTQKASVEDASVVEESKDATVKAADATVETAKEAAEATKDAVDSTVEAVKDTTEEAIEKNNSPRVD